MADLSADDLKTIYPDPNPRVIAKARVERSSFPSISEVIHDQTKLGEAESHAEVEARNKTQL